MAFAWFSLRSVAGLYLVAPLPILVRAELLGSKGWWVLFQFLLGFHWEERIILTSQSAQGRGRSRAPGCCSTEETRAGWISPTAERGSHPTALQKKARSWCQSQPKHQQYHKQYCRALKTQLLVHFLSQYIFSLSLATTGRKGRARRRCALIFIFREGLCRPQEMAAAPKDDVSWSAGHFQQLSMTLTPSRLRTVLLGTRLPQLPAPPLPASCCPRRMSAEPRLAQRWPPPSPPPPPHAWPQHP